MTFSSTLSCIFSCRNSRDPAVHTWPWLVKIASGCDLRRLIERGVLIDDDRALAAELEADRLERACGLGGDALARDGAAGEHDLGHHVMGDEGRTGSGAIARHDVDDAGRNARLGDEPREMHDREAACSAGLTTTMLPAAITGAIFQIACSSG